MAAIRAQRDAGEQMVQVDDGIRVAPVIAGDVFVNIPGDPTLLRLPPDGMDDRVASVPGSGVLSIRRFGLPSVDRIAIIRDTLVVTESRLMTTVPSTREDFAFLQAQQDRAAAELRDAVSDPQALAALTGLEVDAAADPLGDDSYGTAIPGIDGAQAAPAPAAPVERTSLTFTRREAQRAPLYEDVVLRAERDRDLADLLAESPAAGGSALADTIQGLIPDAGQVPRGGLVALRLTGGERVAQVSVYSAEAYLGTVAWARGGPVPASDPWVGADLLGLAGPMDEATPDGFRLLDAIYSAALRGGVPASLAGSFTGVLSRGLDLERSAQDGDTITLAYARDHGPGGTPEGQLVYAALEGPSGGWQCYVVPEGQGFGCHVPGRGRGAGPALVAPVDGVMTSRFGPRRHPILGSMRLHAGVDWAAPTGTPVRAAADGRIARRGVAGGYGNLMAITHAGGMETRYAHLDTFAEGLSVGDVVRAGQVIGTVGTTGRSTGPHLHFETRLSGEPADPLVLLAGPALVAPESAAVDALVNQIIQVESAGNARAKNPLSSATGLGQFIESTWLRMMRTYRPALAATASRADLLALRFDPTLSREMVTRLAQENETFLRARGHGITAGRLYLAHFLGPGGADRVLSAPEDRTIAALVGAGVVRANPFLRNYDVADLKAWADRKMRGRGAAVVAAAPPPAPLDPEVELYVEAVDAMLAQPG